MPYILKENREAIDGVIKLLVNVVSTPGDINYAITKFFHSILLQGKLNYSRLNSLIGTIECVKLEFYRMVVAPYENKKRMENGPVSDLDAKTMEDVH